LILIVNALLGPCNFPECKKSANCGFFRRLDGICSHGAAEEGVKAVRHDYVLRRCRMKGGYVDISLKGR